MDINRNVQDLTDECTFCKQMLPVNKFYKDKTLSKGHRTKCIECTYLTKKLKNLIPSLSKLEKLNLFKSLYYKNITSKSLMQLFNLTRNDINNIIEEEELDLWCSKCKSFMPNKNFYSLCTGQYNNKHYICKWCLKDYSKEYYDEVQEWLVLLRKFRLLNISEFDILCYLHFNLQYSFRKCSVIFECPISEIVEAIISTNLKKCSVCCSMLEMKFFSKMQTSSDGLSCSCVFCNRKHNKQYYEDHKGEHLIRTRIYKTGKIVRTPKWANIQKINEIYAESTRISNINNIKYNVDHIIPLHGKFVSGLHVENNLQIIPASINLSKYNSFDLDYDIV